MGRDEGCDVDAGDHYGILLYLALLGWHVASNPKVIVRLFFGAIDLVPAYFDFVVKEILDELRSQLTARFG